MNEFEWPRDEFGFRKSERQWSAEDRHRYEEHQAQQRQLEDQRLIAAQEEKEKRRLETKRVLDAQWQVIRPIIERFISSVFGVGGEIHVGYGTRDSSEDRFYWNFIYPDMKNGYTILKQKPYDLTIYRQCPPSPDRTPDESDWADLSSALSKHTGLPVSIEDWVPKKRDEVSFKASQPSWESNDVGTAGRGYYPAPWG